MAILLDAASRLRGELMTNLDTNIVALDDDQLLEAASSWLSEYVGIEDPVEAPDRVLRLIAQSGNERAGLLAGSAEAAAKSTRDVVALLRLALRDAGAGGHGQTSRLAATVQAAGSKQCIITPDLIAFGVLMLLGYITIRNKGKARETIAVTREQKKDGRIKITTKIETQYIDPTGAIGKLLLRYLPGVDGGN
jgi:hypothetical protein